jgi:hypothetical protein
MNEHFIADLRFVQRDGLRVCQIKRGSFQGDASGAVCGHTVGEWEDASFIAPTSSEAAPCGPVGPITCVSDDNPYHRTRCLEFTNKDQSTEQRIEEAKAYSGFILGKE